MAKQVIGIGAAANDGTGDPIRTSFDKTNQNFTELYNRAVTSASDPTVNDDSGDGYAAGTRWVNTTTGAEFVLKDASVGAAVWIKQSAVQHPGYKSGNYYSAYRGGSMVAPGSAPSANSMKLVPFMVGQRVTISTIAARVAAAQAGSNIQFAIYAADSNMLPTGNPLSNTNSVSTAATGIITGALLANVTLEPNKLYFFAYLTDNGTPTYVVIDNKDVTTMFFIGTTAADLANTISSTGTTVMGLVFAQTFGSWPDLTGQSFTTSTSSTNIAWMFLVA